MTTEVPTWKQKFVNAFTLNKKRFTGRQLWTFIIFMALFYINVFQIFDNVGKIPENISWICYGISATIIGIQYVLWIMVIMCGTTHDDSDDTLLIGMLSLLVVGLEIVWCGLYLNYISQSWPTYLIVPITSAIIVGNIWFWGWMFIPKDGD